MHTCTPTHAIVQGHPWQSVIKLTNICLETAHHLERLEKVTKILSHETTIFGLKMMVKSGLDFFILKSYVPLQSCCCPVQKNLPIMAELAWQVSRYL